MTRLGVALVGGFCLGLLLRSADSPGLNAFFAVLLLVAILGFPHSLEPASMSLRMPRMKDLVSAVKVHNRGEDGLAAQKVLQTFIIGWISLWSIYRDTSLSTLGSLTLATATWLTSIVWRAPLVADPAATPVIAYRRERSRALLCGVMGGMVGFLIGVVGGGLALAENIVPGNGPIGSIPQSLLWAVVIGGAMTVGSGPWSRIVAMQMLLRARGQSVRFVPLLEDALARQVLRQNGMTYEFRHAELQDRLVE